MSYKILHTFSVLAYKNSQHLEDCIKSVVNQKYQSKVIIVTTTPNDYIISIAKKYNLDIVVGRHTSIGGDFDLAVNSADTELVTIAHQDDIYDSGYSMAMVKAYKAHPDASIIFPDYYEIRNGQNVYVNTNLAIKRVLLTPLRFRSISGKKWAKRFVLRFGDAISCPSVTFVKSNVPKSIFECDLTCDIDWYAWEKLSKEHGKFIFVPKKLMGHRISEESTTTEIINSGVRTKEDYEIYKKFWPDFIAKILAKGYRNSEKSNKI